MKPKVEFVGFFSRFSREVALIFPDGRRSTMQYGSHAAAAAAKKGFEKCLAVAHDKGVEWYGGITLLTYARGGKAFHANHQTGDWYECVPVPDYERVPDDGRCARCEGWGCCACHHTGGY